MNFKMIGLFFTLVFSSLSLGNAYAQSPGTMVFCGAAAESTCYFKPGEEAKVKLGTSFPSTTPNIYFRAYFAQPLATDKLTISVYKDGSFFKGISNKEGYYPELKTAFTDLTNAVWWNDKPFPIGSYKVQVAKQGQVIAEGAFSIR